MRPLYNKKDVVFLNEMILSGLKQLRDNGRENINFLDFTDMSGNLGENIFAPEWTHYWNYWRGQFAEQTTREGGERVFRKCIEELRNKGYLRDIDLSGLTGNFSEKVRQILEETP